MKDHRRPNDESTVSVEGAIFTHREIFSVVDDFYTRVQQDPVLQVPFRSVGDWPEHIERLTHFWWIRFGGQAYLFSQYNPVLKHYYAGFNNELLKRWLSLFHTTIDTHLRPEQAAVWKSISERMGQALSMKNELVKKAFERDQARSE